MSSDRPRSQDDCSCPACANKARVAALGGDPDDPLVSQQFWDQENAWYRDTVRRVGWALSHVFDPTARNPSFTYTAGLWGFDHPELLVFGLDQQPAARLLNQLGERVRAGEVFRDGDEVETATVAVRMLDVPNPGDIIFEANRIYDRPPTDSVPSLQVVYPDRKGTWPWEPECRLAAGRQPMPGTFPPPGYPFV